VHGRLCEALHHGVRWAFAVLASHYDVDLERVSKGYCLPDEDEAARAEVQRLDAAAAGPSAVLASSFDVEILPLASSSRAGADLAECNTPGVTKGWLLNDTYTYYHMWLRLGGEGALKTLEA
jgi:hypothetical protein